MADQRPRRRRPVRSGPPRVSRLPDVPAGPGSSADSPVSPTLTWSLVSDRGIAPSDDPQATGSVHIAGHLNAVLALGGSDVLVGSDSSGVWHLAPLATAPDVVRAYPLSTGWDNPDILALCAGPDGFGHAYAGCRSLTESLPVGYPSMHVLYEAPPRSPGAWQPIMTGAGFGSVYGIGVVGRRIVAATSTGVWWAAVPDRTDQPRRYSWRAASWAGGVSAAGMTSLVVSDGRPVVSSASGGAIWWGSWDRKGALVLRPAVSATPNTARSSLAVCAGQQQQLWCVFAAADTAAVGVVLRSSDGGRSWTTLNPSAEDETSQPTTMAALGGQQGGYNNCIAVRPTDPETALIGWQNGTLVSSDGGRTFGIWSKGRTHLHADVHAIYFDPRDPSGASLFLGSDGGLASSIDLGVTFTSRWNRFLPNLQLASVPCHNGYGTMTLDPRAPGRVAAGLQDNGVVWGFGQSTWRTVEDGDGAAANFLSDGNLVLGSVSGYGAELRSYTNAAYGELATPPYVKPDGSRDSGGLPDPITETVVRPGHAGPPVLAIGGNGPEPATVFGLRYAQSDAADAVWARLATLPPATSIWSFAARDDATILVGTSPPHVYRLDLSAAGWTPTELTGLPTIRTGQSDPDGTITRIVVCPDGSLLAAYNESAYTGGCGSGQIVRFDQGTATWTCVTGPGTALAQLPVFGLDVDDWGAVYAATDDHVYLADRPGGSWQDVSAGLPRRGHLGHLRFMHYAGGGIELALGTWGWSVWKATWQPPPGSPTPGRGPGPGLTFGSLIGSLADGRLYEVGRDGSLRPVGPIDPELERTALGSAAALVNRLADLDQRLAVAARAAGLGGVAAEANVAALSAFANQLRRGLATLANLGARVPVRPARSLRGELSGATAMVIEAAQAFAGHEPAPVTPDITAAVRVLAATFSDYRHNLAAVAAAVAAQRPGRE